MVVRFRAWKWFFGGALVVAACGGKASDPRDGAAAGAPAVGGSSAGTFEPSAGSAGTIVVQGGAGSSAGAADAGAPGDAGDAGASQELPWPIPPADPLSQAVTFQIDAQHSGAQLNDTLRLPLEKRWDHVFADVECLGYPIVARERVFIDAYTRPKRSLDIAALSAATGAVIWSTHLLQSDDSVRVNLAYQDERLFGITGDGLAFALDAATGSEVWRRELTAGHQHSATALPVVVDRVLYAIVEGQLTAISGATGEVLWRSPSACGTCAPTVFGSQVYVGGSDPNTYAFDGTVYAFDRDTGKPTLKRSVPPMDPPAEGNGPETVGLLGERLLVRSHGNIWPLDLGTNQLGAPFRSATVPVVAGSWLLGSNDNVVSALEVGTEPSKQWTYTASSPLVLAGVVSGRSLLILAGTELSALDRTSGTVQSSVTLPESFVWQGFGHPLYSAAGLIAAENKLFVPLRGRLLAF